MERATKVNRLRKLLIPRPCARDGDPIFDVVKKGARALVRRDAGIRLQYSTDVPIKLEPDGAAQGDEGVNVIQDVVAKVVND